MKKKKSNKKSHLTSSERFCIYKLIKVNKSFGDISKILNRGKSTISEEVNNNGGRDKYNPKKAHHRAYLKQYWKKKGCNKVTMDRNIEKFVQKGLVKGWSPKAISNRLDIISGVKYASEKSIRKYIKKRSSLERYLFWNKYHKKSGPKRRKTKEMLKNRTFIDKRPIILGIYGHWEGDFIVSRSNKYVLLVLVEKLTKHILISILPNRNNDAVNKEIVLMLKNYNVKSLTLDNDIAFIKHKELKDLLNTDIYFTHPYCSWEKGLVENTNRWIRVFIPKKTDLSKISNGFVKDIQDYINNKPRPCLSGYTSYEKIMECEFKLDKNLLLSNYYINRVNSEGVRIWG